MQTSSLQETLLLAQRALQNSSDLVFKDPQLAHLREQALTALTTALAPRQTPPVVTAAEMTALQECFAVLERQDPYVEDAAADLSAPSLGELLPFEEAAFMPLDLTTETPSSAAPQPAAESQQSLR